MFTTSALTPETIPPLERLLKQVDPCLREVEETLSTAEPAWPRWLIQSMEHDIAEGYQLMGEVATLKLIQIRNGSDSGQALGSAVAPLPAQLTDLQFCREADLAGRLVVFLAQARRNIATARRVNWRWELWPPTLFWGGLCLGMAIYIAVSALNGAP